MSKPQYKTVNCCSRQHPGRLAVYLLGLALLMFQQTLVANDDTSNQRVTDQALKSFLQANITGEAPITDRYDAEVWVFNMMHRMAPYKIDQQEKLQILQAVYRGAINSDLQPDIVLAVIAIESSFNRFAVSRVGAQGLMQVMPFWKDEIGRSGDNLMDIATNIRYGCKILQFYLQMENGNLSRALARYNGSLGKTRYPEKVLLAWEQHWRSGRL